MQSCGSLSRHDAIDLITNSVAGTCRSFIFSYIYF